MGAIIPMMKELITIHLVLLAFESIPNSVWHCPIKDDI